MKIFGTLVLSLLALAFVLASLITSLLYTNKSYNNEKQIKDWVLLGGLTSKGVSFRIYFDDLLNTNTNNENFNAQLTISTNSEEISGSSAVVLVQDLTTNIAAAAAAAQSLTLLSEEDTIIPFTVEDGTLEPLTKYYYQISLVSFEDYLGHKVLLSGQFQTPAPSGQAFNFTFATAGCAWTGSTHSVFKEISALEPLFFLHLGDFHYEDIGENDMTKRVKAVSTVLSSPSQATLFRSTPLAYVWDDHDWLGNDAGFQEEYQGARDTALQSYSLLFPHYSLAAVSSDQATTTTNTTTQTIPALPIYHAFTIGTVRFILTDLRSECTGTAMFSSEQRAWFQEELSNADNYDFVIWASSKYWIGPDEPGDDYWGGVPKDRQELSDFISQTIGGGSSAPQNLLVVASDAHMLAFDDGSNTFYGSSNNGSADQPILSFPILQTGPLDRLGSNKGGPYTEGCYATKYSRNHQFSTITFEKGEDGQNATACLLINAYSVEDWGPTSSKANIVFSKRLCGQIFSPSSPVAKGSCKIPKFQTAEYALVSVSAVITVALTILSCVFLTRSGGIYASLILWVAFVLTAGFGTAIPLSQKIAQFDVLPFLVILIVQSVVLAIYIVLWYLNANNEQQPKKATQDQMREEE